MGGFAWVTLATNDSYSLGALVLAHSLLQVNTAHQLAVLITPAVSEAMRNQLRSIFDVVKIVDVLDSKDEANLALLKRPELGITFTKLHCWQLTQFEKGVFLDADTLVVRNCDELFEREEFSAAPDVGWPDCFNSGVFVFRPSVETFNNLIQFAVEKGSFDGGDQGLLNQFFNTWATDDIRKHLPFVYNLTSVAVYSYIPAFKQYGAESRIVHFIGPVKPWLQAVDPATRTVTPTADSTHLQPLLQQWWDIFIAKVHPGLSTDLECASGMLTFFAQPACSQDPLDCTNARSDPFPPPPPPEPQAPDFPDPYTPYIEKDDERQYNLPYQPFQVVSSEGELLNITFADFVRESEPQEVNEVVHLPEPELESPEEDFQPQPIPEPEPEPEPKQEEDRQFDYHQFFPDETVINSYLEHNVQEYQPFDLNQSEQIFEPLPRFLTIPEDDSRQSQKPYEPETSWCPEPEVWTEPYHVHDRAPSPVPQPPPITKSQSLSDLLVVDATNIQNLTAWKSQPNIVQPVEVPKKLPGLKPLLPKIPSPAKSFSSPKYTEFTEVNMNLEYSDPFAPPVDNIGFVERAILSKGKPLLPVFTPTPPPVIQTPIFQAIPEMNQYVDLSECQRQSGNVDGPSPITSGGLKTFTPKISPRRMKRSTRRAAEKWKPPETTSAMYDVDDIMKRLSEFSIGYTPPKLPEAVERQTETRADRLFRGSALETRASADVRANGVSADNVLVKNKSHFGPLAYSSPFAAPAGESLSESIPEIVVCVASPENVSNGLYSFGAIKSRSCSISGNTKPVNGTNRTSSSEDSFLSAESNPLWEKLGIDEGSLGISGVKEWEEILEASLTTGKPVSHDSNQVETFVFTAKSDTNQSGWEADLALDSPEAAQCNKLVQSLQMCKPGVEDVSSASDFDEIFESALDADDFVAISSKSLIPEDIFANNLSEIVLESLDTSVDIRVECESSLTDISNNSEEVDTASEATFMVENQRRGGKGELSESDETLNHTFTVDTVGKVSLVTDVAEIVEGVARLSIAATSEDPSVVKDLETAEEPEEVHPVVNVPDKAQEAGLFSIAEEAENVTPFSRVLDNAQEVSEEIVPTEVWHTKVSVEVPENVSEAPKIAEEVVEDTFRAKVWPVEVPENVQEAPEIAEEVLEDIFPAKVLQTKFSVEVPESPKIAEKVLEDVLPAKVSQTKLSVEVVPENVSEAAKIAEEVEPFVVPAEDTSFVTALVEEQSSPVADVSNNAQNVQPIADQFSPEMKELIVKPPQISEEIFSNLATSTPTALSDPFQASYAAAVKKLSSTAPAKPVEPVRTALKPQSQPKQNGLKRPRKQPKPVSTTTESQTAETLPAKYNKRKIEKTELEYPVNRFELLPEETVKKLTHPQKKSKKSGKKFAAPTAPSSLPACSSSVVVDDEEEATPHLPEPDDNPGIAGAIAQLNLEPGSAETDERSSAAQAEYLRRQSWETGKVDYMGRDSFANVWSKISETLSTSPIPENPLSETTPSAKPAQSDSIETLPSDATLSPGEAADDDIIFDRPSDTSDTTEPCNTLPGIQEECEEPVEDTSDSINKIITQDQTNSVSVEIIQEATSSEKHEETPPPSPPIGSDSSAFATYKPVKEPDPVTNKQLRRQSSSEEKRGVFTKILEFVGVVKKKEEVETSIFYDNPSPPSEAAEPEESSGVEGIQEILKATDLSTIHDEEMKKRSPSPRVTIAAVPETNIIAATPPTHPDQKPPRRDTEALTVDNTIPETPPIVEKKTPIFIDRDSLLDDIDGIIEKAKLIAEDEFKPVPVFCSNSEAPKPPIAVLEEFEEIRVTSDEEKQRTVKPSSKLSEQILKAIPPPRRKAISDAKNQSVSVEVEKVLDVVSEQPPPVPPRRRNRSKQRPDK